MGDFSIIRKLLVAGANVNAVAPAVEGITAFQAAAMHGDVQIMDTLLQAGADINACPADYNGRTAIEGAAENGLSQVVHRLLEAGVSLKGRDNVNYRRTLYRAQENEEYEIVDLIQQWKTARYGLSDCATIESIMNSMTVYELRFANKDAIEVHKWRIRNLGAEEQDENYDYVEEIYDSLTVSDDGLLVATRVT